MSKLPKSVQVLLDELYESANLTNKKKIDLLTRTLHQAMIPAEQGGVMGVESVIASQTKNPMVIFKWGANRGELSPFQARQYALQILETTEAAVQDATLYRGVTEKLQMAPEQAYAIITMVRNERGTFENIGE